MGVTSLSTKLFSKIANAGARRLFCIVIAVVLVSVAAVVYADNSSRPAMGATLDRAESLTSGQMTGQEASTSEPLSGGPATSETLKPAGTASNGAVPAAKTEPVANYPDPACQSKVSHLARKYESEVAKEKKWLDDQLTYPPVGSLISMAFINDYNEKVQKIYDEYSESARDDNCIFSVLDPALLPATYPN